MFRGKKVLGIVPARGGSKRIPKKNLRQFGNKPLMTWTIEAARQSKTIDEVILTTDDNEIEKVGVMAGVDRVIVRPQILAADNSSTLSVIQHVFENGNYPLGIFGYFVLLQPTSPLRTAGHIEEAFALIEKLGGSGGISVCRTEYPLEWMGKIPPSKSADSFIRQTKLDSPARSLEAGYQINGAIYILPIDMFLKEKTFFLTKGMVAFEMSRRESIDIDEPYDLELAEWLLRERNGKEVGGN